jgi:hypothetical protein
MRRLIFIIVLFFSTSVFAEIKCGKLLEDLGLCEDTKKNIFGDKVIEPNQRIFSNCKIANIKENMTKNAVFGIVNACREKAKDPSIWDRIRYGW